MPNLINYPFPIRSPQKAETRYFLFEKRNVSYTLKRSRRKSLSIKIDSKGEIIAQSPLLLPLFSIESFLQKKGQLILRHREEVLRSLAQEEKSLPHYKQGDTFSLMGKDLILHFSKGNGKRATVKREGDALIVLSQGSLPKNEIRSALEKWYKRTAKNIFSERLEHCMEGAAKIGITTLPDMSIRNMKSRWGSCRIDRNKITLNLKLIQLEERYIDSVIYHELCHFKVGPHNKAFYNLLEKINPVWKSDRSYLKKEYYSISRFLL